jgi:hypothetical protein
MAASTITVTANLAPSVSPRADNRGGLTAVSFHKQMGATKFGTIGDVMLLAKLPNHARIIDFNASVGILNAAATVEAILYRVESIGASGTLGTLAALSQVMGSFTIAAGVTKLAGAQVHPVVSLSDDAAVQFAVLAFKVAATATESVSFSINGNCVYETTGAAI